ncbi:SDR family NAD(P)-dependent oxidoreductase [Sphingosinicella microcystinivorans]|uniref:SDR family NAD(P)-dependent oxidoreductase n=1 Tax=Sphingosinicella microcystinivorans TaxID=335406 RepID=UPI0022F3853B|nr:SDR family oxidoreductase [Sphingosinicella microcystinivorans]WBX86143.1 SDR family oxidoreductase [Sphingosinicella microcystinivorans]
MGFFDLTGKVAVITGSSRGIGRAIAESMATAGARVVISSRRQEACDEAAAGINAVHGAGTATGIAASISSRTALQELVERARAACGHIDILVCNAASNPYYGPLAGISDDQFRKTLENNILSNHWLIQMVAPEMIARRDGAIIIVSSVGGFLGSANIGAYCISKAADFQLVRNLATELGPHNIRVNAIAPGTIRTDFAKALWEDPAAETALCEATPLGRIGEPEDVAGTAVFLASRAGAYITGQAIVVDGGWTIVKGI